MPFVQAKCPECGGMLAVDDSKKAGVCQFCDEAFIIQDAINNYNTYNTYNNDTQVTHNYGEGAVVNIYNYAPTDSSTPPVSSVPMHFSLSSDSDTPTDFTIEDNVLVKYSGYSDVVVIPDGVTSIGDGAFEGSVLLTSVTIPDSVTSIGDHAFASCSSLSSIIIPDSVTHLGNSVFSFCSNLSYVSISNNVTKIGDSAFFWCESLTSIIIPYGVTSIGDNAFFGCEGLTSVTIPSSVVSIGGAAFDGCTNLTNAPI